MIAAVLRGLKAGVARDSAVGLFFFFQAEDGIRDSSVTGVQTCALPISGLDPRSAMEAESQPDRRFPPHDGARLCFHRRARVKSSRTLIMPGKPMKDRRSEERRVGKSVDLGGRRIIKKKKLIEQACKKLD